MSAIRLKDLDYIEKVLSEIQPVTASQDEEYKEAAVALILKERDGDISIIFIKRSEDERDPWSGHMAFPGGRKDEEDESIIDTVMRETFEETGIDLREGKIIGRLDDVVPLFRTPGRNLIITPFVAFAPSEFDICTCDEVDEVLEIPVSMLKKRAMKVQFEGSDRKMSTYHYKKYTIWGITAWILSQFFQIATDDESSSES
ncbi:MAG: CoA pyrophosphatase [Halobacteriota archaeon]|nr:CoA pyrophosphatase [Halobacteriota archaeon]